MLETPVQEFVVRPTFERASSKFVVIHSQESGAACVEDRRIVINSHKIIRWQLACGLEPNFVQHSSEINETFCFFVIANRRLHSETLPPCRAVVNRPLS